MGKHKVTRRTAEKFWAKVEVTDTCWLWKGETVQGGYGRLSHNNKKILVHRHMYELVAGEIDPAMCVCHHCDTPACIRPDHLFLGTHTDNALDMVRKGRMNTVNTARGERHWGAKLTAEDIIAIRAEYAAGAYQYVIADKYGIAQTTVSRIVRRLEWKHVP